MKLLLDTHVWVWSVADPNRLAQRVRREMSAPQNELWLSPVSVWEALALHAKRRLEMEGGVRSWMAKAMEQIREAPLTHEIVIAAFELPLDHADPADRFLAATANVLDLTLVTADRKLLALGHIATLANR